MEEDDRPVEEVTVADIESVFVDQNIQGSIHVLLRTDRSHDIALILSPKAVATLEAKLEKLREYLTKTTGLQ